MTLKCIYPFVATLGDKKDGETKREKKHSNFYVLGGAWKVNSKEELLGMMCELFGPPTKLNIYWYQATNNYLFKKSQNLRTFWKPRLVVGVVNPEWIYTT